MAKKIAVVGRNKKGWVRYLPDNVFIQCLIDGKIQKRFRSADKDEVGNWYMKGTWCMQLKSYRNLPQHLFDSGQLLNIKHNAKESRIDAEQLDSDMQQYEFWRYRIFGD